MTFQERMIATFGERIVTFRVKCDISGGCDISGLYTGHKISMGRPRWTWWGVLEDFSISLHYVSVDGRQPWFQWKISKKLSNFEDSCAIFWYFLPLHSQWNDVTDVSITWQAMWWRQMVIRHAPKNTKKCDETHFGSHARNVWTKATSQSSTLGLKDKEGDIMRYREKGKHLAW